MDNIGVLQEMEYPLVSVVTPSYNAASFIRETIESVKMQDYPRIQHIVIDGDSTDGTREILSGYPHLEWRSEPDKGQSDALNKGFRLAKGEIIGWLNADDTYQPGSVSTAVRYLLEHENVDLIYSDLQVVGEAGQLIGITRGQPFDFPGLLFENQIKQPTVFMRRRVIEKLHGVDERLHYVMDWEFWLRAGLMFNMQYISGAVFANFRLCQGTKSFEHTPSFRLEWTQVLERAFQDPSFAGIPDATKARALQKSRVAHHFANMKKAIGQRDRKAMFKHLRLSIMEDWRVCINRSTWYYVGRGLLGLDIDNLKRFKGNLYWSSKG